MVEISIKIDGNITINQGKEENGNSSTGVLKRKNHIIVIEDNDDKFSGISLSYKTIKEFLDKCIKEDIIADFIDDVNPEYRETLKSVIKQLNNLKKFY